MKLRSKEKRVDYLKLHSGEPVGRLFPVSSRKNRSCKWSTKKLFKIEVLDTRLIGSAKEVKVHYTGWSKEYDEWRCEKDILDTPSSAIDGDTHDFFQFHLLSAVNERLSCCRKIDSEVTLTIPVPREVFTDFVERIGLRSSSQKGHTIYRFQSVACAKECFIKGWWYRIVNEAGDFCSIELETFQIWLTERPCLEEYDFDGKLILTHRGFQATVRFVTLKGNKSDHSILTKVDSEREVSSLSLP
ncbi:hypothetical protein BSL78_08550 [Apostichopus japonicus]|uniref:Chromo domain-containing protein n=1 Tax=Stichopus japonicus TaxID=307972 RepID=A0A2G8L2S0_STIJA|nr:hypothetical protein BSL78_08550 [Apostichopus japonicus]